ncbi:MAG: PSD1 and planctomycete cytochrome C domain-containing protein [Planctomycetaceae bacterium]
MLFRALRALPVLLLPIAFAAVEAREPDGRKPETSVSSEAFFESTIRPLLAARCFECHSALKQEGGIRLDSREGLITEGDAGDPAIVPGKPDESRLIDVIDYSGAIRMPPKGKLPEAEIASLTEWVRMGAPFPAVAEKTVTPLGHMATADGIVEARASHWAFQPIGYPRPPASAADEWPQTPIDAFISERLAAAGLKPGPAADRRTLLRRATFDLHGLPPTADEVAEFEADLSPGAFARVVDRLLASTRYGERWGRHWLDVARYADTKGYVFTEERKYPYAYTYRDYVIRAFNDDLPFDRFIVEQLAGDQLPDAGEPAHLAAMGFLTVGRRFGNNQPDIIDDRIDVLSRGLLGLTVTCARCHDHKYDPVPTEDYYALYGVFASSIEPAELPLIGQPSDAHAYAEYEVELQKREAALREYFEPKYAALIDGLREKTGDYLLAQVQAAGKKLGETGAIANSPEELRPEMIRRWKEFLAATGRQPHPVFSAWRDLSQLPEEEFAASAGSLIAALNDDPQANSRTNALVKRALVAAAPASMRDVAVAYGKLLVEVHRQWVGFRSDHEAFGAALPAALPDAVVEEVRQVLYGEGSPVVVDHEATPRIFDRETRDRVSALKKEVETWKANSPAAPPRAMVMRDAPQPVPGKVFIRGNPGRPGKEVARRFLQVLSSPGAAAFQQGSGRLELARAVASPGNPLTARVIVNRVWQHHFGSGLVATSSDFGYRGAPPSHAELLDYLARSLIDEGWSLKNLHRRIMLSAVYQQASEVRPAAAAIDPENRLLWRMNRRRLDFEPMRDALLAAAGRLDLTLGGRPVDLFASPFSQRRAVYGFIDRQDLPGTFRAFDFASPDVSTPQRPQTIIPQQALFGMNSPFVIEQARHLAAQAVAQGSSSAEETVRWLYRQTFARAPAADEVALGARFLTESEAGEQASVEASEDSGESSANSGKERGGPPAAGLSTLEQYAQGLLLANEFVFVD